MFIDTHAHLDDGQFPDVADEIERARTAGVTRIINIGYGPERWQSTIALSKRYPAVDVCLGLHPSEADQFTPDVGAQLRRLIVDSGAVGVGEAGIDLFRDGPALDQQRRALAFQIDIATTHDLPLVIHQRSAEREVYEQLSAASDSLRVVLHSFDAGQKTLRLAMDRGWYIGVGGLMTRHSSVELRETIKVAPLEMLLLETDAPYLVPAGVKNRRNTSANIPVIAQHLSELRNVPVSEIERITTENALAAFPGLAREPQLLAGASA